MPEGEVSQSPEIKPQVKVAVSEEEILDKFANLQERENRASDQAKEAWNKIPDARQEQVQAVFEKLDFGEIGLEEAKGLLPKGNPDVEILFENAEQMRLFGIERRKLESEHQQFVVEDVIRCARDLSSRVDFEEFIKNFDRLGYSDGNLAELYQLRRIELSIITGAISGNGLQELDRLKQLLVGLEEKWSNDGFLSKDKDPNFEFSRKYGRDVTRRREELATVVEIAGVNFIRFALWEEVYRSGTLNSPNQFEEVEDILSWAETEAPEGFDSIDFDPRLLDAIEESITNKIQKLALQGILPQTPEQQAAFVANVLDFNPSEIWSGVNIEGFDEKEGHELLVSKEQVLAELRDAFPAYFLKRIGSIIKKENTEGIKAYSKKGKGIAAIGGFKDVSKNGQLVVGTVEWYASIWAEKKPQTKGEKNTKVAIIETTIQGLKHEVGHGIHYILTYDDLKAWEAACKKDQDFVSWYERYAKEQNAEMGKSEGFADTVVLFAHNPILLAVISPGRFEYMRNLFEKYSQPKERARLHMRLARQMRGTAGQWRLKRWTEEDAKSVYDKKQVEGYQWALENDK